MNELVAELNGTENMVGMLKIFVSCVKVVRFAEESLRSSQR